MYSRFQAKNKSEKEIVLELFRKEANTRRNQVRES